jgi:hypothetical protein
MPYNNADLIEKYDEIMEIIRTSVNKKDAINQIKMVKIGNNVVGEEPAQYIYRVYEQKNGRIYRKKKNQ